MRCGAASDMMVVQEVPRAHTVIGGSGRPGGEMRCDAVIHVVGAVCIEGVVCVEDSVYTRQCLVCKVCIQDIVILYFHFEAVPSSCRSHFLVCGGRHVRSHFARACHGVCHINSTGSYIWHEGVLGVSRERLRLGYAVQRVCRTMA